MTNYVTVHLPRAGLGHSLESFSRAYVYYASGLAHFIHPNWFKVRIGPYLRREIDKRDYWRIIKRPHSWGLHPIYNFRRLTHRVVTENTFDSCKSRQFLIVKDQGVHSFKAIQPYKHQLVEALETMSRYPIPSKCKTPTIGIFHRSGDFNGLKPSSQSNEFLRRTHGYGYIPPEYAADALRKCRSLVGWKVPAVLSTDADNAEVDCILSQGNVKLARTDSSFANLLEMRHHSVLILGTSSYGHWSYFLGNSFGIFPKVTGIDDGFDPLGIAGRKAAWFVFDQQTSLNTQSVAAELINRF
jgi:hypothetical protein